MKIIFKYIIPILLFAILVFSMYYISSLPLSRFEDDDYVPYGIEYTREDYEFCNRYTNNDRRLDCFDERGIEEYVDMNQTEFDKTMNDKIADSRYEGAKSNKTLLTIFVLIVGSVITILVSTLSARYSDNLRTFRQMYTDWKETRDYCPNCGVRIEEGRTRR